MNVDILWVYCVRGSEVRVPLVVGNNSLSVSAFGYLASSQ